MTRLSEYLRALAILDRRRFPFFMDNCPPVLNARASATSDLNQRLFGKPVTRPRAGMDFGGKIRVLRNFLRRVCTPVELLP